MELLCEISTYFEIKSNRTLDVTSFFVSSDNGFRYEIRDDYGTIKGSDLKSTGELLNQLTITYRFLKRLYEREWEELVGHKDDVESELTIRTKDKALKRWIERSVIC